MPYCPKCDMEFVDGMTVCSDCGGALAASKELADAMKKQEQEAAMAQRQAEFEAMQQQFLEEQKLAEAAREADALEGLSDPGATPVAQMEKAGRAYARSRVYVKKSQQYDDLKSSASAFLLVGGILLVFSILCWAKIINLPMAGTSRVISQSVLTLMGAASLVVAATSAKSAKAVGGQIDDEETVTRELIQWFTKNHRGEGLDAQILAEAGELGPEELSLKRFDLIQDIIVTTHDITDQAFVDLIAEEIYGKLYQE